MAVFCFGLPRIIIQNILAKYVDSGEYHEDAYIKLFGKKPLTVFPDDNEELLASRAKEFGKTSLSKKQRDNLLKQMPDSVREAIQALWPHKYTLYKDEEHHTVYKLEETEYDMESGASLRWSVFYNIKLNKKRTESTLQRIDGLPYIGQQISLVSVDDPSKQQLKFRVDEIGQSVTSTAAVYLTRM